AARGKRPAVGGECQGGDPILVRRPVPDRPARRGVEEPNVPGPIADGEHLAVRREGQPIRATDIEVADLLSGGRIPDPNRRAAARGPQRIRATPGQQFAVGRKCQRAGVVGPAVETVPFRAGGRVPYLEYLSAAGGDQQLAVRAKRQRGDAALASGE